MIVIKHRKERQHNYYRADCNCGCVFAFDEVEFRNYKTIGNVPNIDCPECGANYVNGSSNIKPISAEEYQKYVDEVVK